MSAKSLLSLRMRPQLLEEIVGQSHLVHPDTAFYQNVEQLTLQSMIFWGPPGTGKTSLAYVIANKAGASFCSLSAVSMGITEVRKAIQKTQIENPNKQIILFIDEIHHYSKSQQDVLLPLVENQIITLIGATTENPSFALNRALLSRAVVYVLNPLTEQELIALINRALSDNERGLGHLELTVSEEIKSKIAQSADGDARKCLNILESCANLTIKNSGQKIELKHIQQILSKPILAFDNKGEEFYNLISALHKSVRGSSPDASLYWLARLLVSGCDPNYIARRLVRMASEDIGNADPRALPLTLAAWQAIERMGQPEGEIALAQATIYLACAAKSNATYKAFQAVIKDVNNTGSLQVPLHLRNSPTNLMVELGYSKGYLYPHDFDEGYVPNVNYFPEKMAKRKYYTPTQHGLEKKIAEKLEYLLSLDTIE